MPLKKGSSRKTVSGNIREMEHSWEKTGKIGNSRPASKKKAIKQATAIALKKAGKSKYKTGAARKTSARTSSRSASSARA
jgi:hypothetical protein